jgi:uncharacterized protein YfiM (DUF2279 family)
VIHAAALAVILAASPQGRDRWFGPDKAGHFLVGFSIGAGTHAAASLWLPRVNPILISTGTGVMIAGGKELFDLITGHGSPSWRDFAVTFVGDLAGQIFSWAVQGMFRVVDLRLR